MKFNKLVQNTTMLYLMNIAKLVFPFFTFPYLTRVLSVDGYAVVSYVKSTISYLQLLVDFGFMLSATKLIVDAGDNKEKIGKVVGNTIAAKLALSGIGFIVLVGMVAGIPLLQKYFTYTVLSYIVVVLSSFLLDYLFRGIEQMQEITIRFVVMKGISTVMTFALVHSDADLLWIPLLDVLSSIAAVVLVWKRMGKYNIRVLKPDWKETWNSLKKSFTYFISGMATTAFSALNTLLIGVFLSTSDIAIWSVVMQIVSAVQVMYNPIIDGVYPEMIRKKNAKLIRKILFIFMPIVIAGSFLMFLLSKWILLIVAGEKYVESYWLLRMLLPVLLFSFPAMVLGWPCLGAIGKVKETSFSTIVTAVVQTIGLALLIATGRFTLLNIAVLRGFSELVLLSIRTWLCTKFRSEFVTGRKKKNGEG